MQVGKERPPSAHDFRSSVGLDLPPLLRQTVKTRNPMNGESSPGFVTQAVQQGIQAGRGSAAGVRGIVGRGSTWIGGQPERVATLAARVASGAGQRFSR